MMAHSTLAAADIGASLDEWLDTGFTYHKTEILAAELAELDRDTQDFILGWIRRIASTNITLAWQFGRRAPELLSRMERRVIEAWAVRLCDTYDISGLQPALKVMEQVDSFTHTQTEHADGALFEDLAPVLTHFVRGLSGRKLRLEQGDAAWTDAERIVLPGVFAALPRAEDNFRHAKATIAMLWAQTRFGTLRPDVMTRVMQHPQAPRALACFAALETLRLDARLARELPGLHRHMQAMRDTLGERVPDGWQALRARLVARDARVEDSLALIDAALALEPATFACFAAELRPEAVLAAFEARREQDKARLRVKLAEELARHEDENPEAAAADESPHADTKPKPEDPKFEVAARDEEGRLDFEITLDGKPLAPPENVKQLLTSIYLDFGAIPPDYLVPAGDGEYDPALTRDAPEDPDAVWQGTYHEKGAELYPEWDMGRQHYRKNWCVMREKPVAPVYDDFCRNTLDTHAGLIRRLRKSFEAMRDETRLLKRQEYGDDVDIDALVEALADARDGREMSDRLFVRMHRAERNIAVAFMVDMSGSTRGWINEAEREALILLAEALERLGDRYAIYGFSGQTRKRCELYRIKTFDEAYSDEVKARIAGIAPQDYTRMGFAIRHLSKLLQRVEARTRVLVTLSDGRPDDYFDVYRGPYGIEDTRMALIEARRAGIHPFCITIDKEGRDYLPHMYGAARYTVLDDVRDLPIKVADIYRRITT